MDWIKALLFGSGPDHAGVAHAVFVLAVVIAFGIMLGKLKVKGISFGVTWVLFVGIVLSHFGMTLSHETLHFVKEFGLILFVYSVGMQVGPGFFSSFKKGGMRLVGLATMIVGLGVVTVLVIHYITGIPMPTMVGVMSGAVTNTPGLGAAQQAYSDTLGVSTVDPTIALGYAVAYPLGVVGVILVMILSKYIFRVKLDEENKALDEISGEHKFADKISVLFTNTNLSGRDVGNIKELLNRTFVISRICRPDGHIEVANAKTVVNAGDKLLIICSEDDSDAIVAFFGERIEMTKEEWGSVESQLVSRRILITKPEINGMKFRDLRLRTKYGINITRVNRSGVDLIPYQGMELQMGDRVMVVGSEKSVAAVADVLGNSMRKLREPNLIPIFVGIFLGVLLGSVPIAFPGIPQPVKLGLAGGPLIVAILISRFGPHFKMVTYTTMSANLMLREVGITLFLAAVGLGAGEEFVDTIVNGGGYRWIGYGVIITMVPLLITACVARLGFKLNYYTLTGLMAGSTTNPPALAYANATAGNDMPALSYATVYPVVMFLRVLAAQLLIMLAM